MDIQAIRTPGLGDTTYVLTHDGLAVVVDPQRDSDRVDDCLNGAEVRFVLETHVHNDYVSGGRDLALRWGAELVFPAGAAPTFRHRPAFHHEDIEANGLTVRPIHTPGHTPEHTSYLVLVDGIEIAVFSGGSLLSGSAGRTDLLGWDRAESLARLQYGSVHRLSRLSDSTRLCPTHGAGSFCSAAPAGRGESTIGEEKQSNPVLSYPDEDAFVIGQLTGLPAYPTYYQHMGPINILGTMGPPTLEVAEITADQVLAIRDRVTIIDCRSPEEFADGHIPGSISVELTRSFGVWVGWIVDFNSDLVLVTAPGQDSEEAIRQLARIGFDNIKGVITDLSGWPEPLATFRVAQVSEFVEAARSGQQVVDTRAPSEWETGSIEGSSLIYVPDIVERATEVLDDTQPVWVVCESGFRAGIAASLLALEGFQPVIMPRSGVSDVLAAWSNT